MWPTDPGGVELDDLTTGGVGDFGTLLLYRARSSDARVAVSDRMVHEEQRFG